MSLEISPISATPQAIGLERAYYPQYQECKVVKCFCNAYNCMNDWYYDHTNQEVRNIIRVSTSAGLTLLGAGVASDPAIREACHATAAQMAWGGGSIGACANGCSTYLSWEDDTRLKVEQLERIEKARQKSLNEMPLQIKIGVNLESTNDFPEITLLKIKQEELQHKLTAQAQELEALKEKLNSLIRAKPL